MSAAEFLRSTPPEINWKIEAWNDAKIDQAINDYSVVDLTRKAVASLINKENKFPSLKEYCPEAADRISEQSKPKTSKHVSKAMNVAKALGHI